MSINDYRINRIIGKGSFATVFKAFSRKTQKPVAIKIFSKKMSKQEEELARKEVSISRTIDHPNIIHLYDEFRRNDTWYMVFEYCGKGDLDKLVGKKGTHKYYVGMLKEEIVALLAVELVEAVFYLAEKNIAHRDIKPANILITDQFEVKLADLGFAKAVHQQEDFLKTYAGTPLIMAPEIFESGKYTNKCDIWSLGIVFYQLLFGTVPFNPKRGGMEDLIALVKNGKLEFPRDITVSQEAKDMISKCLEKNPSKRPSASELRIHPWLTKARQSQVKLPQVLASMYNQESRLFDGNMEEEDMVDQSHVPIQINNSLKRAIDTFVQDYQDSVEKFLRSYRGLLQLFTERGEDPTAVQNLQQYFYWKIQEMEQFNLQILLPDSKFDITCQEFGKPKLAVDQLRKFLPLDFVGEQSAKLKLNMPRTLIKHFAKVMEIHAQKMGNSAIIQATTNITQFLKPTFDNFSLNAKIWTTMTEKLTILTLRGLKDVSKNDILRMISQKKQDLGIPLMDILDFETRLPNKLPKNVHDLIRGLEEARGPLPEK